MKIFKKKSFYWSISFIIVLPIFFYYFTQIPFKKESTFYKIISLNTDSDKEKAIKLQELIQEKEKNVNTTILKIIQYLSEKNSTSLDSFIISYKNPNISYLIYKNKKIIKWGESNLNLPINLLKIAETKRTTNINNKLCIPIKKNYKNFDIVALIYIKSDYPYSNKHFKNEFIGDFAKFNDFEIHKEGYKICNLKQKTLFYIKKEITTKQNIDISVFLVIIVLIAFTIFFILVLYRFLLYLFYKYKQISIILFFPILIILFRLLSFEIGIFDNYYVFKRGTELIIIFNVLIDTIGLLIINRFIKTRIEFIISKIKYYHINFILGFLMLLSLVSFLYVSYVLEFFIFEKNIIQPFFKLDKLTLLSIILTICIIFLATSFFSTFKKVVLIFNQYVNRKNLISSISLILIIYFIISFVILKYNFYNLFFLIILVLQFIFFEKKYTESNIYRNLIYLIELSIFFAIYTQLLYSQNTQKNSEIIIKDLLKQNDARAERDFVKISNDIIKDTTLIEMMKNPSQFSVNNYLMDHYFYSINKQYEIQITICNQQDKLFILDENKDISCYTFFISKKIYEGTQIKESNFYLLNNNSGKISYFADFYFTSYNSEYAIFIEIDSKPVTRGTGYPEVLREYVSAEIEKPENYYFAKYYKGNLIESSGFFNYETNLDNFPEVKNNEIIKFEKDGYNHNIYRKVDMVVVLSEKKEFFLNQFLQTANFLLFFSIGFFIFSFRRTHKVLKYHSELKHKIIFFISISLALSFVIGAIVLAVFDISKFINAQESELYEKINKTTYFLKQELDNNNKLFGSISNEKLSYYSNIINSDVNLYDKSGILISTSKPEMIENHLIGNIINPDALNELKNKNKTISIQYEKIGNLKYLSSYATILNKNGQVIFYVNIPYFNTVDKIKYEIPKLLSISINTFVITFLFSMIVILLIFRKILKPLESLRLALNKVDLTSKFYKIEYKYNDEIGLLVNEYNLKVEELKKQARFLAENERESAWKDVSRQVAHEIKNPLTPMKLSIQFLEKAYENKHPELNRIIKNTCEVLIEQIENLSNIATSFSNFAKMPDPINEKINIIKTLNTSVRLFEMENDITIKKQYRPEEEIYILGDDKQLQRVFTNLIKNGVQAVVNKTPEITIKVIPESENIVISIFDNGEGIEDSQKEKIYMPNFTTKGSGMGLGLSIVKNIIEKTNAEIWFKTKLHQGTTFFVKFRLLK